MKVSRNWIFSVGAILLICILVEAPASLLVLGLQREIPTLKVGSVSGSLWRGSAYSVSWPGTGQGRGVDLSRFSWKLKPWSLLLLSPAVELDAKYREQEFQGRVSTTLAGTWRLQEFNALLPAQALALPTPLPLSGRLSIAIDRLTVEGSRGFTEAQGRIALQDVSFQDGSRRWPLGNFAADLGTHQGQLKASMFDLGGPGSLEGEFLLAGGGQFSLSSLVAPRGDDGPLGQSLLTLLGEPTEDGRVRLQYSGQLW